MSVLAPAPALMQTYRRWPVRFVEGRGCRLVDDSGKEYLDFVAGLAVASLGHCHPEVTDAIARQASRLVHVSNLYETEPAALLAERLASSTGGMQAFFCNSGAEAVECALKLARKHGGDRRTIVAADGGFHGRTMGALAVTGQPAKRAPFEPLAGRIKHVPFGDAGAVAASIRGGSGIAAVILEPIQGEAGVIVPPPGYLTQVREICDAAGALLILDEVQTGVGRTGRWFAYEHEGVRPDLLCLAKGLGGGLPIGACLAAPEVAASFSPGDHGSTFGGNPVAAAAALAVLDVIDREGLLEQVRATGATLQSGLRRLAPEADVRGRGLLVGAGLPRPVARAVSALALRRGLLVNDAAPGVLRLTPPLVVSEEEVTTALSILEEVWDEIRAA